MGSHLDNYLSPCVDEELALRNKSVNTKNKVLHVI